MKCDGKNCFDGVKLCEDINCPAYNGREPHGHTCKTHIKTIDLGVIKVI